MKLKEVIQIKGKIQLLSGLHIGTGNDEISIGGVDSPVIRNPLTNQPYIPGSSIKGKMRSLLEWYLGKVDMNGSPWHSKSVGVKDKNTDEILRMFGNGKTDDDYKGGPTRLSFFDCFMTEESKNISRENWTEEKAEVSINRISGTASNVGPRHIERVSAGISFQFQLSCKVFEMKDFPDDRNKFMKLIYTGLKLIELDAIGGSGSRGYGKVRFELEGNYGSEYGRFSLDNSRD